MSVKIREISAGDEADWLRMRVQLWPDSSDDHALEIRQWFAGQRKEPLAVLLALVGDEAVGFVELSIRPYAEKCHTENVAYLEGWFVSDGHRRQGVGYKLVEAARDWGRARGCTEFASDANAENAVSIAAHTSCGFEDAGLIRCFMQRI